MTKNKNALTVGGAAERVCGGAGNLALSAGACPPPGPATGLHFTPVLTSVLRIHDILVWIRIRRSMLLTNGSGFRSGSSYFRHWPSRGQQKTNLKKSFSAYYCLKVNLRHFSKIKSHRSVGRHLDVDVCDGFDRYGRHSTWISLNVQARFTVTVTV